MNRTALPDPTRGRCDTDPRLNAMKLSRYEADVRPVALCWLIPTPSGLPRRCSNECSTRSDSDDLDAPHFN
jgi:hypothetical protein